jgi:hypothetical protein
MLRTLAMLACGLCSTAAIAADIDAYHVPTDGRPAEIAIIGEIRYGDERKFASVADFDARSSAWLVRAAMFGRLCISATSSDKSVLPRPWRPR